MPAKGIGISPYFKKAAAAAVTPSPLIAAWYAALSVKPSSALLTSLNTLVNGMNTDGDWTELDFFSLSAGMETEEQALRPLKTTGNSVQTSVDFNGGVNFLPWTANGWATNGDGGILSGYNPFSNGVKYTLNSAFAAFYGNTRVNTSTTNSLCGGDYTTDEVSYFITTPSLNIVATSLSNGASRGPNDNSTNNSATKSKTSGDSNVPFYSGIKRTASNSKIAFINNINSAVLGIVSTGVPNGEFASVGTYSTNLISGNGGTAIGSGRLYARATIFGSGLVSQTNTGSRLNTFFQARGLNPYV